MTVIRPNSVAGINSITVQSGNSLAVHKANGELIRTITSNTGVSTFSSISVGTATTDNSAGKSINIGLGASISQHDDNTLTFGTAGDPQVVLDANGHLVFPNNGKGVVFGDTSGSNRPSITGSYTSSSNNHIVFNVTGSERVRINSNGDVGIGTDIINAPLTVVQNDNSGHIASFRQKNVGNSAQILIESPTDNNIRPASIDLAQAGTIKWSLGQAYAAQSDRGFHIATSALSANDTNAKLTITTAGAVGISSLIPTSGFLLDVGGDVTIGEPKGNGNSFIDQKEDGDLHIINSGRTANGASGSPGTAGVGINRFNTRAGGTSLFRDFCVYDGKDSKILVVDGSAAAVGIGTDSPQDTLDVANTVPQIRLTDLSDGSYGQIRANGGNLILRADEGNTVAGSIINFEVDGDEKVRINDDGQVLIGTASAFTSVSYRKLQVGMSDGGWVNLARTGTPSAGNHVGAIQGFTKSPDGNYHDTIGIDFKAESSASNTSKPMRMEFYTTPSSSTTKAERMRLDKDGTLFIGKPNQSSGTAGVELYADGPNFMTRNGTTVLGLNNDAGTNGDIMRFYFQDVHRGNLNFSSGSFSATTASDYRLKENDTPLTDGISRVKKLRPIRFNFKDNPSETLDGFFAHELQEVVPDCVTGEKDGAISERGEGYQCISKEGLVPLLTAALQDAITKIETLETNVRELNLKVSALGGG